MSGSRFLFTYELHICYFFFISNVYYSLYNKTRMICITWKLLPISIKIYILHIFNDCVIYFFVFFGHNIIFNLRSINYTSDTLIKAETTKLKKKKADSCPQELSLYWKRGRILIIAIFKEEKNIFEIHNRLYWESEWLSCQKERSRNKKQFIAWKIGCPSVPLILTDNMGERIRLDGDSDFVLDILNLMCCLKMSQRQLFIYSKLFGGYYSNLDTILLWFKQWK